MLHQHLFHVDGRDPQAADLEHVVHPAYVAVDALLATGVAVAADKPRPEHRRLRLLVLMPVLGGTRVALDLEDAGPGPLENLSVVVGEAKLVSGHGPTACAELDLARSVRAVDVQHLGRTDAV